jgi:hypothetical protein
MDTQRRRLGIVQILGRRIESERNELGAL